LTRGAFSAILRNAENGRCHKGRQSVYGCHHVRYKSFALAGEHDGKNSSSPIVQPLLMLLQPLIARCRTTGHHTARRNQCGARFFRASSGRASHLISLWVLVGCSAFLYGNLMPLHKYSTKRLSMRLIKPAAKKKKKEVSDSVKRYKACFKTVESEVPKLA
jgi:hypothetical protein